VSATAANGLRARVLSLAGAWSPASTLGALFLSIVIVGGACVLEHNLELQVADEGFLWYGAWRTMLGEMPLRDFDSYDPGRYYWTAIWLSVFGNDLLALRLALAALHLAALFISLIVLRRATRNPWLLSAAAIVIACWLFPRHKAFEPLMAILGVYLATRLIEAPSAQRVFTAGILAGAAAVIGRNHGVYLLVSFLALLAWRRLPSRLETLARDVAVLAIGVVVGYAPMLALIAFAPGFAAAFAEQFQSLLRNTPLSLFWTWEEISRGVPPLETVKLAALGCLQLIAPAMYAYLLICLIRDARRGSPTSPVVAAATFVGIVYVHYMFFRPDIRHFAQAVGPLLVGWAALAAVSPHGARRRTATIVGVCFVVLTAASVVLERPIARYWMGEEYYRTVTIKGRPVIVQPGVGRAISATAELASRLSPEEPVLIVPNWPVLYVLLDRRAPIRESYTLAPENAERQRQIIRELTARDVRWIVVNDLGDNRRRAEYGFQKTHPLVWQHILSHYAPEPLAGAPRNYLLFRATGNARGAPSDVNAKRQS
jgi:hypothetical protein